MKIDFGDWCHNDSTHQPFWVYLFLAGDALFVLPFGSYFSTCTTKRYIEIVCFLQGVLCLYALLAAIIVRLTTILCLSVSCRDAMFVLPSCSYYSTPKHYFVFVVFLQGMLWSYSLLAAIFPPEYYSVDSNVTVGNLTQVKLILT